MHVLVWCMRKIMKSQFGKCKNVVMNTASFCRLLSNAYLNSSNFNVLPSGRNVVVARPAALKAKNDENSNQEILNEVIKFWSQTSHL